MPSVRRSNGSGGPFHEPPSPRTAGHRVVWPQRRFGKTLGAAPQAREVMVKSTSPSSWSCNSQWGGDFCGIWRPGSVAMMFVPGRAELTRSRRCSIAARESCASASPNLSTRELPWRHVRSRQAARHDARGPGRRRARSRDGKHPRRLALLLEESSAVARQHPAARAPRRRKHRDGRNRNERHHGDRAKRAAGNSRQ